MRAEAVVGAATGPVHARTADGRAASGQAGLTPNRWGIWETVVLLLYAAVVAAGVTWHEPWADEAQAWLLARDLSWWPMMLHGVRYEGSPGLWHTLLWVLIRLHVSYAGMHLVAAGFAASGIAVLLRYAPFPRLLRLLLPFSFFLCYQDAVVARSYVLFTVLAFAAAAVLRGPASRPQSRWLLAALLGLMANLSLHCFLASLGLAAVAWAQYRREPGRAGPAALLAACWLVALATAMPAADVAFPAGKNITESWNRTVATLEHRRYVAPTPKAHVGELTPEPPPVHHRTGLQSAERRLGRLLGLITFPLSTFPALGLAAAALVVAQAWRLRGPTTIGRIGLVPYGLTLAAFLSIYIAPRHTGVIFVVFLVTAWLTWPVVDHAHAGGPFRLSRAVAATLLLITLEQIGWTAHALRSDLEGAYSGGEMTAAYLREHAAVKRVDGFYYHSVASLPYFERNIYQNQHAGGYWDWSSANRTAAQAPEAGLLQPDYVVVGGFEWGNQAQITVDWSALEDEQEPQPELGDQYHVMDWFKGHGYRETHRFCGHAWMRTGYSELLCEVILEPVKATVH